VRLSIPTRPCAPCGASASAAATGSSDSDISGETLARIITLIESAKMNGLDPQAYLADLLDRTHDQKINRLDELQPWNWTLAASPDCAA